LVLTNPVQEITAARDSGMFSIAIDVEANGAQRSVIIDGLDAAGTVIATGASPEFAIYPIDSRLAIYMAAPNTIAAAPVELASSLDQVGIAPLSYGAMFAGGRDRNGSPSDAISIYNVYDHALTPGAAMPEPRSGVAVGGSSGRYMYLFGGRDAAGEITANLWRFDAQVAPSGAVTDFPTSQFPRSQQAMVPISGDRVLITGAPALELSTTANRVAPRGDAPTLPANAAAITGRDGVAVAVFASADALTRFRNDMFDTLDVPMANRSGAAVIGLPDGKVAIVCGDGDAIRLDPVTGVSEAFSIPTARRTGCAVAATQRHLVIAGGTTISTGAVATTAEVYDATTLNLIATTPLVVPRTGAQATALPNDQIIISSGLDERGAPSAVLELFTPASRD